MRLIMTLLLFLLPAIAQAETKACLTVIDGQDLALSYDSRDETLRENRSTREWLFGRYGKVTCPGFVTLRAMTPGISDTERTPFCLYYNDKRETYSGFGLGERDAWLVCKQKETEGRFCRGVNATKETAADVAGKIATAARKSGDSKGRSFLHDASGAAIASGAGSYVTSTLGTAASSALAAVTAPATLTAAAVSVVAVGGAVYVCGD